MYQSTPEAKGLLFRQATPLDIPPALEVLHDALNIPDRLRMVVDDPLNTTYVGVMEDRIIAGAVVHWDSESEIEVLAVHSEMRREGVGQAFVSCIVTEARNRQIERLLVGTANLSLDNIMFYQKCGFRMSHIRRNYFKEKYPDLQVEWRGVKLQDMIVFEYDFQK